MVVSTPETSMPLKVDDDFFERPESILNTIYDSDFY